MLPKHLPFLCTLFWFECILLLDLPILLYQDNECRMLIHLKKNTLLKLKYLFLFQKASLFCWSISVFLKVMIGLFQVKPYLVKILRIVSWDISISNFLCIISQSFTVDNKGLSNAQSTTNLSWSEFSFLFLLEPITL